MKTAVCISGQPRFFDVGQHFIYNNIIKPNDCDVFLHAWYDKDKNKPGSPYSCASWNEGMSDVSGEETDSVVRLRYDCAVIDSVDFSDISQHEDFENSIYYCDVINNPKVMCDYFNFGSSKSMDKYAEIFDNLDSYWNEDNIMFCGEELLTHHIRQHHKLNTIGLPISTLLVRDRELKNQNFGRVYPHSVSI